MKSNGQSVKKAEEIREREHRLKPNLRLKTRSEIVNFIHDRGLVSVLGGNELPSLISAVMGKAWRPSSKGFSGWLDWWSLKIEGKQIARISSEIERRDDILATRVFRRTKTFVSDKLWPVLDSIVRHQSELVAKGKILSALERKLLEASIEACVIIREDQIRKWFEWSTDTEVAKENLLQSGKFRRADSYLVTSRVLDSPHRHL